MNKRGQLTIFIIVGVLLIGFIIAFFFLFRKTEEIRIGEAEQEDTQNFLEVCLEDSVREGINLIFKQGGYIENPLHISFKLDGEENPVDISYLCYSDLDNHICVVQEPVLSKHIKDEIREYLDVPAENCFYDLLDAMKSQGYSIDSEVYRDAKVNIRKNYLEVDFDAELTATRSGETFKHEDFSTRFLSDAYDIIEIIKKAVNQKATACTFFYVLHNRVYPEFIIDRIDALDGSEIYIVRSRGSGEEFRFAVRGCIPSGGII